MKNRVVRFEQEVFELLLNGLGWEAAKRAWNAIRSRLKRKSTTETHLHETGRIHFEMISETIHIGGSPFVLDDPEPRGDTVTWHGEEEVTKPEPPTASPEGPMSDKRKPLPEALRRWSNMSSVNPPISQIHNPQTET